MASQYWIKSNDTKVHGPFDGKQLKTLATAGKIYAETLVSKSQLGPWVKAGAIKGLSDELQPPPSQPEKESSATVVADTSGSQPGPVNRTRTDAVKVLGTGIAILAGHFVIVNLAGIFFPYFLVIAPAMIFVGAAAVGTPKTLDAVYCVPGTPWWAYATGWPLGLIGAVIGLLLVFREKGLF